MLIQISWRNIWRNRSRSLVIITSVAMGLWAGISLLAFYNGMLRQRIRSAIDKEVSHIQIHHPAFSDDQDLRFHLGDGRAIQGLLNQNPEIRVSGFRIICVGMISSPAGGAGAVIHGIDPGRESLLTQLSAKVSVGTYFTEKGLHEVLIGEKLATKLRVGLRQKIVLTVNDRAGSLSSGAYRIVGLYKSASTPYDEVNVFIKRSDAAILGAMADSVNEMAILLHRDEMADSVAKSIAASFPEAEVKTWKKLAPEMQLLVVTTENMLFIFMGIILLALGFGIINTMLMSVLERTREIGMLISLGMSRLKIFSMIVIETFFLVMAGCPAGILLALLSVDIASRRGIDFSKSSELLSSFGWDTVVYPWLGAGDLMRIVLLVAFTALVSAILPARRALVLDPAKVMRR